jgi:UDP-GlcNAc:undecaprenyl-phosphate GlcNAc-1-phosphate transferase
MKIPFLILTSGICAFIFVLILVPIFKLIALKVNLVDKPNERKIHQTPVPLIGGICISASLFLVCLINPLVYSGIMQQKILFSTALVLLFLGILDDKYDIKAKLKLLIQLICSFSVAFSGIRIFSFYGLFGIYEIPVYAQYAITVILITGVVNSINLMDGVDGLLGEIAIIGFSILMLFSIYIGNYTLAALYFTFICSILGFLKFNLPKHEIFMGDAGALFLGNILICSTIYLINSPLNSLMAQQVLLFSFVGFFSIPVLDSLRVYLGRMKNGSSPFKADKTHLHHLLLLLGFSHKKISFIVSIFSIVFLVFCLVAFNYIQFSGIILVIIILFSALSIILNLNKKVLNWQEKIRELEKSI